MREEEPFTYQAHYLEVFPEPHSDTWCVAIKAWEHVMLIVIARGIYFKDLPKAIFEIKDSIIRLPVKWNKKEEEGK